MLSATTPFPLVPRAAFVLAMGAGIFAPFAANPAAAALPAGLDSRALIGPYLNSALPTTPSGTMPSLLSATGAFSNTAALTPHGGLVPYAVNSPFWSDSAVKTRWIALPYDGTAPGSSGSPTIGFSPTGKWSFPNGTVFVKHFELVVNEQTGAKRRLETRILIRDANGGIFGNSYRWRGDNTDADIVNSLAEEIIQIIGPDGTPRNQTYYYPSPSDCLRCHNDVGNADPNGTGMVLGIKTRQLNGSVTYAATGRTDNQLHTWNHLGMLSAGVPDQTDYPQYDKLVAVDNAAAPLEHRVRSYLDANCAQCHRPGGQGPAFDARFTTPVLNQNLIGDANGGSTALIRHDIENSRIFARDSSTVVPMPPVGRNLPHQAALDAETAWVTYPFDVVQIDNYMPANAIRVRFDRALDAASAGSAANYALDNGASVVGVVLEADRRVVTLLTSGLASGTPYRLTVNRVKELQAPQNFVWPNSSRVFTPQSTAPAAGVVQFTQTQYRVREGAGVATVTVTRTDGGAGAISVDYSTAEGTGLAGVDYTATSGTLNWANGDTTPKTFNVPVLLDATPEGERVVNLFLANATGGAAIGGFLSSSLRIVDFGTADFNADGRSDILWYNTATGTLYEMQMNGFVVGATAVIDQETDLNWKVVAVADLNGDGKADVVWQHATTGQVYALLMNGTGVAAEGLVYVEPNTQWKIVAAGDFNGDGRADLLWKNDATGDVFMLLMNGLSVIGGGVVYSEPNANWKIQKVADFNGDRRADILWRNIATGDVFILLMNGTAVTGGGVIYSEPNTNWQIQAAADFNGDGKADVLWRNVATGDVFMMLMDGTAITGGSVFYGEPNADWKIVASGDYDGNDRADILWRNTATGQVYMMRMNGYIILQGDFVYTETDQNWKILGP